MIYSFAFHLHAETSPDLEEAGRSGGARLGFLKIRSSRLFRDDKSKPRYSNPGAAFAAGIPSMMKETKKESSSKQESE